MNFSAEKLTGLEQLVAMTKKKKTQQSTEQHLPQKHDNQHDYMYVCSENQDT
jgi:hypothetical protein